MALFNRNKKKETTPAAASAPRAVTPAISGALSHNSVLRAPRITEKAALGTDSGVYVFNVEMRATKPMIAAAVESLFKVTPRKIRITMVPSVQVRTRQTGKSGFTRAGKKAYVYLKKGDTIELA